MTEDKYHRMKINESGVFQREYAIEFKGKSIMFIKGKHKGKCGKFNQAIKSIENEKYVCEIIIDEKPIHIISDCFEFEDLEIQEDWEDTLGAYFEAFFPKDMTLKEVKLFIDDVESKLKKLDLNFINTSDTKYIEARLEIKEQYDYLMELYVGDREFLSQLQHMKYGVLMKFNNEFSYTED